MNNDFGKINPSSETRLGRMLSAGRLTATMLSKKTQRHITLTMESKKKVGGKWENALLADASHVFIKMGEGGYGAQKLATYYPASGKLYWDTPDKAWRYAVTETFRAATTGVQETDLYSITEANFCGVCGRALTSPTSIALGIGPDCEEKYMGSATARTVHYTRDEANLVEDLKPRVERSAPCVRPNEYYDGGSGMPIRVPTPVEQFPSTDTDKKGRNVPRTFEALAAAVKGAS